MLKFLPSTRHLSLLACLWLLSTGTGAQGQEPPSLSIPVDCDVRSDCVIQNYVDADPGPEAKDYRCGTLAYNGHGGTDFRVRSKSEMRAGVAVLAAAPGVVVRLRDGMRDISVKLTGKETLKGRDAGNAVVIDHGNGWETQYSHLRRGSIVVTKGQKVEAGDKLGLIGLSGRTEFPHLHMSVRHDGKKLDPFTGLPEGGGCGKVERSLWSDEAAAVLGYHAGGLVDAGFADQTVALEELMDGMHRNAFLPTDAYRLQFWVLTYGMLKGDKATYSLLDPTGKTLKKKGTELTKNKAQIAFALGQKRQGKAWPAGTYRGQFRVERPGENGTEIIIDIEREIELR